MKLKKNIVRSILLAVILLAITVSVNEYSKFSISRRSAEKNSSPVKPAGNMKADTKKPESVNPENSVSTTTRNDETPAIKKDSLIEGIVVSKDIVSGDKKNNSEENYYIYLRDTSGRLRKFETTKFNYQSVKTGDHIFYKYTSGKNYKMVVSPPKL